MNANIVQCLILGAISLATPLFATASAAKFEITLTPGPLLNCLEQLSRTAHVRIIDHSNQAASSTCTALHQHTTLEQTLDHILKPAGLTWHPLTDGTVEIVPNQTDLNLAPLRIDGEPVPEPERPIGPAPTVLAEHATALTRLDRQWLDTAPLLGFNQIGRYAPNVYGTGQSLAIRGIERDNDYFTSLTVSLDGINLGARLLDDELVPLDDLQSLDLVRGPRSFEAGGGSEAGAIRLVTAPPGLEPTLRATAGIGNENAWQTGLAWSGPVGGFGLGATLALNRRVLPNFVHELIAPTANRERTNDSARLKLDFSPDSFPGLNAQLAALALSGDSSERWIDVPQSVTTTAFNPFDGNSYTIYPLVAHTRAHGAAGLIRYTNTETGSMEIRASNTRIERNATTAQPRADYDVPPDEFQPSDTFEVENHKRLGLSVTHHPAPDWTWTATLNHEAMDSLPYSIGTHLIENNKPSTFTQLRQFSTQTNSAALWLEHAWGDTWYAGVGLRWLREQAITSARDGTCYGIGPCTNLDDYALTGTVTHKVPVPLATLEWQPSSDQSFSLSYGYGYRSGGSVGEMGAHGIAYTLPYVPEQDQSVELAWHAQWHDQLHTSITAFNSSIRDHFGRPTFPTWYPGYNNGLARIQGIEGELDANLTERWKLRAGLGLLRAHYQIFHGEPDLSLPGAPRRTAVFGMRYGAEQGWYCALDAYHAGAAETSSNLPDLRRPPYSLLDARIGFRSRYWDTAFIVGNSLNEKYLDRVTRFQTAKQTTQDRYRLGDSRRIELRISRSF